MAFKNIPNSFFTGKSIRKEKGIIKEEIRVLCFALARLGAIAVAVNTRYRGMEVEDIVG